MFEKNSDMKLYFEKFKGKENAALLKSEILIEHATVVMEAIDTSLTELDDAEKTHSNVKKLGAQHKARGVKEAHLDEIREPFLKAVEETLGSDRYTDRMRTIYETFIDYIIKTMKEGYNGQWPYQPPPLRRNTLSIATRQIYNQLLLIAPRRIILSFFLFSASVFLLFIFTWRALFLYSIIAGVF